ncbi:MAG: cyclic nucleotide-binding domain-containing protein [Chlamydiia bacterium]|nr:cyclic nucleotide-binding domain-containing protein [Chlamydiia bacterium]
MRNLNLIDKAFLLKKTSLFETLDLDILISIADKMEPLSFHPSEMIFHAQQEGHLMYFILSGEVSIDPPVAHLRAGEFFGDEALFGEKRRGYSARCRTCVDLLALSRSHIVSIMHECPTVALSLLESYAAHLPYRKR